jgi:NADPH:quinone reductase-like Zn-dependent oxidoreductase
MRAAIYTKYGPASVLSLAEVPRPVPTDTQVLVRVFAATVNRTDCGFRTAEYLISRTFTGLVRPKRTICGSEFAGEVVAVGAAVTNYNVGDRVFGFDDVRPGAHAEYFCVAADGPMAVIPEGRDYYEMAAAGEGASYALSVIEAAKLLPDHKVLVYGASGAIGSAAVQILRSQGIHTTAVCGTKGYEAVKKLGPTVLINYECEDFMKATDRFNLIFDAVGKQTYGAVRSLLAPKGMYYSTEPGPGWQNPFLAVGFALLGKRNVIFPIPKINQATLTKIKDMIIEGSFAPVIDRSYPLSDIVAAATYVESAQKIGNVVIEVVPRDQIQ